MSFWFMPDEDDENLELNQTDKKAIAALPKMKCFTCLKHDAIGFRHHAGMCTAAVWCEECGDPPCDFCGRVGVSYVSPWDEVSYISSLGKNKRPLVHICEECVVAKRRHPKVQA